MEHVIYSTPRSEVAEPIIKSIPLLLSGVIIVVAHRIRRGGKQAVFSKFTPSVEAAVFKFGRVVRDRVRQEQRRRSTMSGSTRKELLVLYRKLLRSAATFPSKKRESIYQAIREEWRENAALTQEEKIQKQVAVAYKGLTQLRQFDEMTMTGGKVGSSNWSVTLEQNPMPKPANYGEKQK